MDKTLRILFITSLFAILGMQIFFLIEKHSSKPVLPVQEIELLEEVGVLPKLETVQEPIPATSSQPLVVKTKALKEDVPEAVVTKYVVNPDKCISCRLCIPNCPVDAIRLEAGVAVIDKDKCIGCGICVDGNDTTFAGCPVNAIDKTR